MTDRAKLRSFPDLNGEWAMDICWQRNDGELTKLNATAFIRSNSEDFVMTVRSTGSDSHTLSCQPGYDVSGEPVIRYLYEIVPKAIGSGAGHAYNGAAILHYYPNGELSGNYWTSQLTRGHFSLVRKTAGCHRMSEKTDVVLITAIKEEYEAAKDAFSADDTIGDGVREWHEQNAASRIPYVSGTFYCGGSVLFQIALARPPRMGGISTAQVASVLIDRLSPRALVMCGVCAGNPKDLALGDIVISELAYQYDEGKTDQDGFKGDHRQSPVLEHLVRAAESLDVTSLPSYGLPSERDSHYWLLERLYVGDDPQKHPARTRYFGPTQWRSAIESLVKDSFLIINGASLGLTDKGRSKVEESLVLDVDPPITLPFTVKVGPIASGNVVVKDGLTWSNLEQMGVRTVLGLEMEAAAIGATARSAGVQEWIVMKGVMDHADPRKDDRYKPFAAKASAETLRLFLIGRFNELLQTPINTQLPNVNVLASGPVGWRPRMIDGPFFDQLREAIEKQAPAWLCKYDLALDKARQALNAATKATDIVDEIRLSFGDRLTAARNREVEDPYAILTIPNNGIGRARIAKIWNSHDEYLGEAIDGNEDGLGMSRIYVISEETTPTMRSSFTGEHESNRYGPFGVFTFPDQSQFSGEWTTGHPSFGYREYSGHSRKLECDFYLGPMEAMPNGMQPIWRPHGKGIAVDAARRLVRCGNVDSGAFSNIDVEFKF